MKRTQLNRRAPIARGRTRVKPRNSTRSAKAYARNFGDEADVVRAMPCLLARHPDAVCRGPVQAAHVVPRGMGGANGGRFDLVPLCAHHHADTGEQRTTQREAFEHWAGLDLRAEADRIALEHGDGLGIRGLAQRWAPVEQQCGECSAPASCRGADGEPMCAEHGEPLERYELDALLGWVRRHCESGRESFMRGWNQATRDGFEPDGDGEQQARAMVLRMLGPALGIDEASGCALADAAGWPS